MHCTYLQFTYIKCNVHWYLFYLRLPIEKCSYCHTKMCSQIEPFKKFQAVIQIKQNLFQYKSCPSRSGYLWQNSTKCQIPKWVMWNDIFIKTSPCMHSCYCYHINIYKHDHNMDEYIPNMALNFSYVFHFPSKIGLTIFSVWLMEWWNVCCNHWIV